MENLSIKSRKKWQAALITGSLGLLFLSGCVYTRLLEVKRQLREFETYFALQGDPDFILFCKSPVMLSKDVVYLIGAAPLKSEVRGDVSRWHYEFERVPPADDKQTWPMDRLSLGFDILDGKMQRVIVPPGFMQLFSRQILTETLLKAPDADVLQLRKTVVSHNRLSPEADAQLPGREKTLSLLGRPLGVENKGKLETLIYRYKITGVEKNVPIIARLSFSSDGLMRRAVIHWDSSTMDVEFLRYTDY